jgi:penicillin-binding protein-related factor A (putative recombinase)
MSAANRGKKSEADVNKFLAAMGNRLAIFDWHRVYDARSAGGRFNAQTGDFAFYTPNAHGIIEVKEVDHKFRLPNKNFDKAQIAKCRKREMAGGKIGVVVNFTEAKKWALVPLNYFYNRLDQPSWDLTEFIKFDSGAKALEHFFNQDI